MERKIFYIGGQTAALDYAAKELERQGHTTVREPDEDVSCILLDVPVRGDPTSILSRFAENIPVIGGKLQGTVFEGRSTLDLLEDTEYLAQNAAITAHCALKVALPSLPVTLQDCPVLVVGWGRIGKCLGRLLRAMGAKVSIYARKETDCAMIAALGYHCADLSQLHPYRIIFNTVPAMVLPEEVLSQCGTDCLKIELASQPGMAGDGVISAGGLPGKEAPESSGALIARRILHLMEGVLS